jgi:phosphoribosylformylglycinamidine synthase
MEMAMGGGKGAEIFIDRMASENNGPEILLFSESQGRFVVEVGAGHRESFEKIMRGTAAAKVGTVSGDDAVRVFFEGKNLFTVNVKQAADVWRSGLQW